MRRLRGLAARSRLGERVRGRRDRGARDRARRGRHLRRHRGRLRRWTQRADHRAGHRGARGCASVRRDEDGPARSPCCTRTTRRRNYRAWIDRSRENLGLATLDLVQLHGPPSSVFADDALFDDLDSLVEERRIAAYGVSVETCDQALAAIARPRVATVQIILNAFRLKPLEQVLPAAAEAGVGIIARVPLASGLLSGRYTAATHFSADDHRSYNRARRVVRRRARPSQVSTSRRASRRCAGSRPTSPPASRWRSGRSASCSTSPACPS